MSEANQTALTIRPAQDAAAQFLSRSLLAFGILVHIAFVVSLRTGWLNPFLNDAMHRFGPGMDFFSIYAAGANARSGASVYLLGTHAASVPYAYPFRYAPIVAYTLGAAMSLLPAASGYQVWLIVCELTLLFNIYLTMELADDLKTGCAVSALWLMFTPFYLELYVGQFTFLTTSMVFWAYAGWSPRRSNVGSRSSDGSRGRLADTWMEAAVLLKMMPLLFVPIMLLRGRWKGLVALLAVLILSSAAYFARYPHDWALFNEVNITPIPTFHAGNLGLMGLLFAVSGDHIAVFLRYRALALGIVGLSLVWMIARAAISTLAASRSDAGEPDNRARERDLLYLYAALSASFFLIYKDVWEHHYVLLLPPLILLALRKDPARIWLVPYLFSALPTLFVLYDVHGLGFNEDPQYYWTLGPSLLQHGWKVIAPLWLLSAMTALSTLSVSPIPAGLSRRFRSIPVTRPPPTISASTTSGLLPLPRNRELSR